MGFLAIIVSLITLTISESSQADYLIRLKKIFAGYSDSVIIVVVILFIFFLYLIFIYFVELWKTIIINRRKVVVLREMLGLNYGSLELVFPKWRVEGATSPFVLKLFPGLFSPEALPFWTITILANFVVYALLFYFTNPWYFLNLSYYYYFNIAISLFFVYRFRKRLLDANETMDLKLVQLIASALRLQLVENFEYVIYRAKLAVSELQRININTENIKTILLKIEDKKFFSH